MTHDVFVSYPSSDKATADAVASALESRGIRCWFAPRDVPPGADWAGAIVEAIRGARLMVLVFSDATNASEHILREVRQAADADVPILPFRTTRELPSSGLDYYIGGTHWLDALTPPLERHLAQLGATAEHILGDAERRPAAPSAPTSAESTTPMQTAQGHSTTPRDGPDRRLVLGGVAAIAVLAVVLFAAAVLPGREDGARPGSSAPTDSSGTGGFAWVERPASGHWYALTETGRSWTELEGLAQAAGAQLVAIDDPDEEEWLFNRFGPGEFWIGLTDRAVEGEWTWTSGEPATYLNWCAGEPTDTAGGAGPEDAAYAVPSRGCWFDEGLSWTEFGAPDGTTIPSYPGVLERDSAPD